MSSPYSPGPYWGNRGLYEYPSVEVLPPPSPMPRQRIWLHVLLFALTVVSTVPMPAGTFVTHFGKQIHYDGAKDEDVYLQIVGMGPGTSTPAETK